MSKGEKHVLNAPIIPVRLQQGVLEEELRGHSGLVCVCGRGINRPGKVRRCRGSGRKEGKGGGKQGHERARGKRAKGGGEVKEMEGVKRRKSKKGRREGGKEGRREGQLTPELKRHMLRYLRADEYSQNTNTDTDENKYEYG
jgi:hypothetical protein